MASYKFGQISPRDLALQRCQFLPRLMVAAGYAGWIVLVDEVELMGRYSLRRRARSYGEMARLLGILDEPGVPGLTSVFAITSAYQSEVMDEKEDEEKIVAKLRASGKSEDLCLARQVPQENMVLDESRDLQEVYDKARSIYSQAYSWDPTLECETNNTWRIASAASAGSTPGTWCASTPSTSPTFR